MSETIGQSWPDVQLFKEISSQATQAAGINVSGRVALRDLKDVGDPEKYLIIDRAGDFELYDKPQPRRAHKLLSCADVIEYVASPLAKDHNPVIWISPQSIVVTSDDDRLRGDSARYDLSFTELYDAISTLGDSDGYPQSDFLRLLRVDLARAFARDDNRISLIDIVRSLMRKELSERRSGGGTHEVGVVSRDNESIKWPDSLKLSTTVIDDPVFSTTTYPVEVMLEVTAEGRVLFELDPVPVDLKKAVDESMKAIVEYIKSGVGDTPVFLGSPA